MKTWSIGCVVAAALTFAPLASAVAGVTIFSPHSNHAPPMRMGAPRMNRLGDRSAQFARHDFRHDRDRRHGPGLWFGGYDGYGGPDSYAAQGDGEPLIIQTPGPSINVTIEIPAPPAYYPYPPAPVSFGGPKIITIGAPRKSAHARPTPTIIYGSRSVAAD